MIEPCQHHAELCHKIDEIHSAVCGNQELGHRGLVKRMADIESNATRATVYISIVVGGAMVAWEWIRVHLGVSK